MQLHHQQVPSYITHSLRIRAERKNVAQWYWQEQMFYATFRAPSAAAQSVALEPKDRACDDPLILPRVYMIGVWLSIVLAIGVTSLYAFQVTERHPGHPVPFGRLFVKLQVDVPHVGRTADTVAGQCGRQPATHRDP